MTIEECETLCTGDVVYHRNRMDHLSWYVEVLSLRWDAMQISVIRTPCGQKSVTAITRMATSHLQRGEIVSH